MAGGREGERKRSPDGKRGVKRKRKREKLLVTR